MLNKIKVYGKAQNRTALGIFNAYQTMYPNATLDDMKKAFPDSLNPDSGTKMNLMPEADIQAEIDAGNEWYVRGNAYFTADDEWINFPDGSRAAVVRMWSKPSFERLVNYAKRYAIEIAEFEKGQKFEKGGYRLEYLNGYVPTMATEPEPEPEPKPKPKPEPKPIKKDKRGCLMLILYLLFSKSFWFLLVVIAVAAYFMMKQ